MTLDLEADLAAFFATDDFAVCVAYSLQGGGAGTITGIFDQPDNVTDLGETGFLAGSPTFTVQTSALPAGFDEDASLTINGKAYRVTQAPQGDGTGVSILMLEDAS
ncbi:head-tail joining protein [Roseibium sp.]|uniref:head-tail joining protein n=1 Tax=Roseibium sp. TaxID=1936156 RepID=UPI003BABF8C7